MVNGQVNIVADPNIPFVSDAFAALGIVTLVPGRELTAASVRDADILICRSTVSVNSALLDGSRVKFVGTATIGFDHVDLAYLAEHGIGFASAAGSNANSVAEYVVAAMLEIAHRQKFHLRDKTLGVVGVGHVGSRVVRYAEALGMRVLQNDPPRQRAEALPQFVTLDHLLGEADIITLHVPLNRDSTDATFHLFDKDRLVQLAQHRPILINTSRGAVVDNKVLLKAIDGAKIGGAVLDVWENEPTISPELLDIVDIGTPHIAGHSFDGKVNGLQLVYEAACQFLGTVPTWSPESLMPSPAIPQIAISVSSGDDNETVLRRIIKRIYDISADDAALRKSPRDFERLRMNYPARREFFNTALELRGSSEILRQQCLALGFK